MKTITLEELLEAGCHFGHQVTRHNPKSRDFVFEARDNIHIIDLAKTKEGVDTASVFLKNLASKDGSIIVVGTKRQAAPIIEEEVKRAKEALIKGPKGPEETKEPKVVDNSGLFYVTKRWIGGTMTNFAEIEKNLKKLKDITSLLKSEEERALYTKKELGLFERERQKLESFYNGIMGMKKAPDALVIVDTHMEHLAVRESRQTHVPTVGMVDTNSDPTIIDYPIPANDDAVGSIKIIIAHLMDAWIEGKLEKGPEVPKETNEPKVSEDAPAKVKEKKVVEKEKVKEEVKEKTVTKAKKKKE